MRNIIAICLLAAVMAAGPQDAAREPRPEMLPEALRAEGAALLNAEVIPDRVSKVRQLARKSPMGAMEFLLAVLERDSAPAVRREIVSELGRHSDPRILRALERAAASDPDPALSTLAAEKLGLQRHAEIVGLLGKRSAMAAAAGNAAEERALALEQERWISLRLGGALPGFMRMPPPLFAVKPPGESIRVLAFGDYGQGNVNQQETAAAMLKYHRAKAFDFAITLGDNFYPRGMDSPSDPRWKTWWEELYDPRGIQFYITLGNHDWGQPDSPAAEFLYAQKSPSWRLPATRYTFTAGAAQFFALDTQAMSKAQLLWLDDEIRRSRAPWKIAYGHHPIYSHGQHGDTPGLITDLLPVLGNRVDAFFAGHEHDLQHLKAESGVNLYISGGGGARIRPIVPGARSLFAKSSYGFAVIELDARRMKVTFVDQKLATLHEHTVER